MVHCWKLGAAVKRQTKPITIVGGGLAGLTLGIGLRREGIPVTVWEAGHYPRHRVCGEFISGQGQAVLRRLDLLDSVLAAGGIYAKTAIFFFRGVRSPHRIIPEPALCLSRFDLDTLLAERLQELGGDLRAKERWRAGGDQEALVLACGRRAQGMENGRHWFGLKIHARNVASEADLEMHATPVGYVGLTRLGDGLTNVCGLFGRRAKSGSGAMTPWGFLRGEFGTPLHERLRRAIYDESSACAVAGLSLRAHRAADQSECRIGDALTLIAPVTGNGMSMALEAADLAVQPLAAYSRGQLEWRQARAAIAEQCDSRFARRLWWAGWLQRLVLAPAWRAWLSRAALRSDRLWSLMFDRTR